MSMGYQVGVTPLQMAAAMSAVANGGTWIEPRVVRAVVRDGVRTRDRRPRSTRRAISPETAAQLRADSRSRRRAMAPASSAQVPGYTVAGKTGTADKIVNGRYSRLAAERLVRRIRAVARSRRSP